MNFGPAKAPLYNSKIIGKLDSFQEKKCLKNH
jgi:hypothetical protein